MSGRGKGKAAGKKSVSRSSKAGLQVKSHPYCCFRSVSHVSVVIRVQCSIIGRCWLEVVVLDKLLDVLADVLLTMCSSQLAVSLDT